MCLGSANVNTNIAIFEYETNAECRLINEVDIMQLLYTIMCK